MYQLMKKYLFTLDPEEAHERTMSALRLADRTGVSKSVIRMLYGFDDPHLQMTLWGITFRNPVGLAAGFDKNAEAYHALAALGFGFVEVGTLTPVAQLGNDKPRLFRSVEDQCVINRMGFNNRGVATAARHLQNFRGAGIPIGINIGKNKLTPNEAAASDYEKCLDALYAFGHYFVINVSSPNTPNLRDLQETESLRQLLKAIRSKANQLEQQGIQPKPLLLKVAPDMTDEHMRDVVQVAMSEGMAGMIATNTTLSREEVSASAFAQETGGLSGRLLTKRATAWTREIYQEVGDKLPIIGVGGIFTGDDAYEKIRAGASLVQVYTGMIFEGPSIVKAINQRLLERMQQDGFTHLKDAIGTNAR